MPRGSAVGISGEYIHHVTGVLFRLNGSGNLQMTLWGLDDATSFPMVDLTMALAPGREPTRLANFRSQRTRLEVRVDQDEEWFRISRIIIFAKPSATSYPM